MAQIYHLEIFIDTVGVIVEEDDTASEKKLTIKIHYGPKAIFIIKEEPLNPPSGSGDDDKFTHEDITTCDENNKRKFTRKIRAGKSFLFPSSADSMLLTLSKFPLEIEVWHNDKNEEPIFVGVGRMIWDTAFYHMLKATQYPSKIHDPLTIKQTVPLKAECCCKIAGDITFFLRINALGDSVITEFQQSHIQPDRFRFRTNKAPTLMEGQRIVGEDANFTMIGSIYETVTLEDPDIIKKDDKVIEVCTDFEGCGLGSKDVSDRCHHDYEQKPQHIGPIVKAIRMGDITGPCGNSLCPLAQRIKNYIKTLDAFKKDKADVVKSDQLLCNKDTSKQKVSGACDCSDDTRHREACVKNKANDTVEPCAPDKICDGLKTCTTSNTTHTSEDQDGKKQQVNYMIRQSRIPNYMNSIYGQNFIIENIFSTIYQTLKKTSESTKTETYSCSCSPETKEDTEGFSSSTSNFTSDNIFSTSSFGATETFMYNTEVKSSGKHSIAVYQCTDIPEGTDCKCSPLKPSLPCKTIDCGCIEKTFDTAARKKHKPFCPCYKHKETCPVTLMKYEEELKELEEEPESEPLPYGLPPIKLGPCPVMGRPCSVPDGFARMYKNALQPAQPPSYSDAGKVCCSKEYQRIRGAIKEYMKYQKDHEYKCINKFNVDTERRCCDREQLLFSLTGKSCCGAHKLAIQDKYQEDLQRQKEIQKK